MNNLEHPDITRACTLGGKYWDEVEDNNEQMQILQERIRHFKKSINYILSPGANNYEPTF